MHIAVITSAFNSEITFRLLEQTKQRLQEKGARLSFYSVPGALELPYAAQQVARNLKPDAIICLGAVIRGETDHYDYVCDHSIGGLMRVSLDEALPVINGILTVADERQAWDRLYKGAEFADCALEMAHFKNLNESLKYS